MVDDHHVSLVQVKDLVSSLFDGEIDASVVEQVTTFQGDIIPRVVPVEYHSTVGLEVTNVAEPPVVRDVAYVDIL